MEMANEKMEDEALRLTGHMERFNITRTSLKFYNKVNVTARYAFPCTLLPSGSAPPLKSLIYQTLAEGLKSQSLLGVVIEDEDTREPRWRRLETIDFDDVVSFVEEDPEGSWDEWILKGHREELDRVDELPLWRVVVASKPLEVATERETGTFKFAVAFFYHHAIGDGLSGAAFHLTFKDALNTLLTSPVESVCNSGVEIQKIPLVHCLEQGTTMPLTIWFLLKKVFTSYIYNPVDTLSWTGPLISASMPRPPCNLKSFDIEPLAVARLVKRCREERTTVTALVTVLTARKLALLYPEYKHFKGTIPFSMRGFSGHGERDMGVFVTNIEQLFCSSPSTPSGYISCRSPTTPKSLGDDFEDSKIGEEDTLLWQSAREMKNKLNTGSASPKNQNVALLAYATDYKKFFLSRLGAGRDHAFEITNIGVVDGSGSGEGASAGGNHEDRESQNVVFDKVSFSGSISLYGSPYTVAVASAKGGCMNVCVRWGVNVVSEREARGFAGWLERELKGHSSDRIGVTKTTEFHPTKSGTKPRKRRLGGT
ncbi:hypothetical protein BJ875DRAFT_530484 [Amylocarpus encephaloides]|uniref:Alcohol acetyltransferase n=1 Tax=Amylocarpus encephaloides TaxID=45428 RepID=A0A9P7YK27_9HELO|nr:hypothetical protein BJ875DRAFT_530484 [Amylocarpus encephaloides]